MSVVIELDNNATTRPDPRVVEAMSASMREAWHNPSAVHRAGQAARRSVDRARAAVAELIGAQARDVIFTSGATEAIALGVRGVLRARTQDARRARPVIVTTPIEHEAVHDLMGSLIDEGLVEEVRTLGVTRAGVVDTASLGNAIDERVAMVCCQWANNETGAIQPIEEVARAAHDAGAVLMCDGTQWVGKMPTRVRTRARPEGAPVDLMAFASHKMHGSKGAGALYVARGVPMRTPTPGTQERERRGGTEATPAIVGFGVAAELAAQWLDDPWNIERMAALRDRFEARLVELFPGAHVNGPTAPGARLWNTTNIAFPGVASEILLMRLSEAGVHASAGAACSSGSVERSRVLLAMGVPEASAQGSVRFSLSRETTEEELDRAVGLIGEALAKVGEIAV